MIGAPWALGEERADPGGHSEKPSKMGYSPVEEVASPKYLCILTLIHDYPLSLAFASKSSIYLRKPED